MIKRTTVLILLVFAFMSIASAQSVPGFQGKKAYVAYNFNFKFIRFFTNEKNTFVHDVQLAYIVSRRGQIGLTMDFYAPKGFEPESDVFTGNALGISYTSYKKNALAPVGKYIRYELKYTTNKYENGVNFTAPVLCLGVGTRRIFFNRLMFNIGIDCGLVLKSFSETFDFTTSYGKIQEIYMIRTHVGLGILLF